MNTYLSRGYKPFILLFYVVLLVTLITSCGNQDEQISENPANNENIDQENISSSSAYKVFAVNRRGMAFPDQDFSVSAIFPPANFLVAQVLQTNSEKGSKPILLDDSIVELRYSAVADKNGSINSYSSTKSNFWNYSNSLFYFYLGSLDLEWDEGFHGTSMLSQWMPGRNNVPQSFNVFDASSDTFSALYVPVTPIDDNGNKNYFPLFKVEAIDRKSQQVLASTIIPLPMAEPMNCQSCHQTGKVAANDTTAERYSSLEWSDNPNAANNAKENLAIVHGIATGLDIVARQPYFCAECHYSPVYDPEGRGPFGEHQTRRNKLSISIHAFHGLDRNRQIPSDNANAMIPENGELSCKICHGGEQPYARGAMHRVAIECQDCHGGMIAVGKSPLVGSAVIRRPFLDEPRCESCHTGDEVSHLGNNLVYKRAYASADVFATPRVASNRRFAEQPGTLYRSSLEHGGLTCISCHGSPHAIWPVESADSHDNDIAANLQGHSGSIIECDACHAKDLLLSLSGPHGLHNINSQNWVNNHATFYSPRQPSTCQACHGKNLLGSRLSKAAANRSFSLPGGITKTFSPGQAIGCDDCHTMP